MEKILYEVLKINEKGIINIILSFFFGFEEFTFKQIYSHSDNLETDFFPLNSCLLTYLYIPKNHIKNISYVAVTSGYERLYKIPGFCLYDPEATNIVNQPLFTRLNYKVSFHIYKFLGSNSDDNINCKLYVKYKVPKENTILDNNEIISFKKMTNSSYKSRGIGSYRIYPAIKKIYFESKNEGNIYFSKYKPETSSCETETITPEIFGTEDIIVKKIDLSKLNKSGTLKIENYTDDLIYDIREKINDSIDSF